MSEATRQQELIGDKSLLYVHNFMEAYKPHDNEDVVEISVEGRGEGDVTLIAQCAQWLNAVVFDCQFSKILTEEQWLPENYERLVEEWDRAERPKWCRF